MKLLTIISSSLLLSLTSCIVVAPYEKQFVNDPEMQMSGDAGKGFNNYVNTIREGAIPAEGTKASGGCGCY